MTNGFTIDGPGPDLSQTFSETVFVTVDGKQYVYETWFTNNAGGAEWYDAETLALASDPFGDDETDERAELFEQALETVERDTTLTLTSAEYSDLYQYLLGHLEANADADSEDGTVPRFATILAKMEYRALT